MSIVVVALGGNAILLAGEKATFSNQMRHLQESARTLISLLDRFDRMVITHGNGPQVGEILLQNELARDEVPPMPLDICVAQSQGQIAHMLQMALLNELLRTGREADVLCCLTTVEVGPKEEAPSIKPIGPYYGEEEMTRRTKEKGWSFVHEPIRGGYRRVVPSPRPCKVIGLDPLDELLSMPRERPLMIIAGGGGGVPITCAQGRYHGVEAVIDKDLTSSMIACATGADTLIMLTDIEAVYLDYGTPSARPLGKVSPKVLKEHLDEGQFPSGSMGPKVKAALDFVQGCGVRAIITNAASLDAALEGKKGTTVVQDRR